MPCWELPHIFTAVNGRIAGTGQKTGALQQEASGHLYGASSGLPLPFQPGQADKTQGPDRELRRVHDVIGVLLCPAQADLVPIQALGFRVEVSKVGSSQLDNPLMRIALICFLADRAISSSPVSVMSSV